MRVGGPCLLADRNSIWQLMVGLADVVMRSASVKPGANHSIAAFTKVRFRRGIQMLVPRRTGPAEATADRSSTLTSGVMHRYSFIGASERLASSATGEVGYPLLEIGYE